MHLYFQHFPGGNTHRRIHVKRGRSDIKKKGEGRLRHNCREMDAPVNKPVINENLLEVSAFHCSLIFVDKFDIGR